MRVTKQRFHGLSLSRPPADPRNPTAVETTDPRISTVGIASAAIQVWRWNIELKPLTDPPCVEYLVPEYILSQPGPAISLTWNRIPLYQTEDLAPIDGDYLVYRTDDDPPQQRIRLGRAPDLNDRIIALWYVVDFTLPAIAPVII